MQNKFYVYAYLDPRKPGQYIYGNYSFDYEPFYIGKGCGRRKGEHLAEAKKNNKPSYKLNKIRKIISNGLKPIIKIYKENMHEYDAFNLEIEMILSIGRIDLKKGPLTNLTNGGDGTSGVKISLETINKISNTRKEKIKNGEIIPTKHTNEWRNKLKTNNPSAKYVDDESIIKLIKNGKTNVEVSKITGITLRIIYNRLEKYNLKRNKNKNDIISIDIDKIHEFILNGLFYKDIAKLFNVSESCISRNYRGSKYYTKKRSKWDNI